MSKAENAVTKACMDYLTLIGAFVWRNNSRTVMMPGKGGKMRPMFFGKVGSPDIIGILPGGRFIGVECKKPLGPKGGTGGSVQSAEQVEFEKECKARHGLYVLARSSHDVHEAINRK